MIGFLDIILLVLFVIVAPLFVYLRAKKNGHKPVYWALITLTIGVAFQFILPVIIGIILAVALVKMGNSPNSVQPTIQSYSLIIGISGSILNAIGVLLVLRRVNKANNTGLAAPNIST